MPKKALPRKTLINKGFRGNAVPNSPPSLKVRYLYTPRLNALEPPTPHTAAQSKTVERW